MTRDEAINKVLPLMKIDVRGDFDTSLATRFVIIFEALGLIKFDPPKPERDVMAEARHYIKADYIAVSIEETANLVSLVRELVEKIEKMEKLELEGKPSDANYTNDLVKKVGR